MINLITELGNQFNEKYEIINNKFENYISELKILNRTNDHSDALDVNFFTEFRKKINNCSDINNILYELNKIISDLKNKRFMRTKDVEAEEAKKNYQSDYKECKKAFSSLKENIDKKIKESFDEILNTLNNFKNIYDNEIKYEILTIKNDINILLLIRELIILQNNTVEIFDIEQEAITNRIITNLFDITHNSLFEKGYVSNIKVLIFKIKKGETTNLAKDLLQKDLLLRLSIGLNEERNKLGFSLSHVARKINVNKSTLSRIERNDSYKEFPAEIANKLAEFFNKSLQDFLSTNTYIEPIKLLKVYESLDDYKYKEFYNFYVGKKEGKDLLEKIYNIYKMDDQIISEFKELTEEFIKKYNI